VSGGGGKRGKHVNEKRGGRKNKKKERGRGIGLGGQRSVGAE